MILGGIQIGNSVSNYVAFQRVQTLAHLNALVVQGAAQLADERDDMAGYVASGRKNAQMLAAVNKAQAATSITLNEVSGQSGAVAGNGSYRQQTVLDLKNGVLAGIADLTFIRKAALSTQYPPLAVIQSYDRLVTAFDTFSNDIAAGSGNATLQTDNSVLNALLRMEDDASLQRAYLYQALASTPPNLTPVALADLNQAFSQQQADTSQFNAAATVAEAQTLNNTVAGPQVDEAQSAEKRAIASAESGPARSRSGSSSRAGPNRRRSAGSPPRAPRSTRCGRSVTSWSARSPRRPTRWSRRRCATRSSSRWPP